MGKRADGVARERLRQCSGGIGLGSYAARSGGTGGCLRLDIGVVRVVRVLGEIGVAHVVAREGQLLLGRLVAPVAVGRKARGHGDGGGIGECHYGAVQDMPELVYR